MNRRATGRRGIALIIVMIAISVLSILAAAFAFSMKVETKLAQNRDSETELVWLGRSGVEYARWILAQQLSLAQEPYDGLNQIWAGGPGGFASSNSILLGISLKDYQLGDGKFSITITDMDRKFNINVADQNILDRAMGLIGVDAGDSTAITGAILDWIDQNDGISPGGVESEYYETLNPSYRAKNRPMDDISELQLVRGVTPDLYWGGAVTNHSKAAFQSTIFQSLFQQDRPQYFAGLQELFTPLSGGRININTANLTTLQLLPFVDESVAAKIIELRSGPDGADGTEDDMPAGMPGVRIQDVLLSAGLNRNVVELAARYCAVRSTVFEVQVEAEVAGYRRTFYGILGRNNPRDVQVLGFYWK